MTGLALPTKPLGRTGLTVTTIGVGCAWLGQPGGDAASPGAIDEAQALATIWAALAAGVRLLDTAPLYLQTESERLVAKALRERPDLAAGVLVHTKCGHLPAPFDYSAESAWRGIEGSLARLGVDHLPLVSIHDAPIAVFDRLMGPGGALAALRRLQAEGVIGHIGIAVNNPAANAPYIETGEFELAVVPEAYSLLNQVATERIFPAAERFGMGILLAVPLEKGLLATGARAGLTFPGRHFSPAVLAHVGQIEALCVRHGVSLLAVALQFCTRHPAVSAVIPGARQPAEATTNALAMTEAIPDALWDELRPLVRHWDEASRGSAASSTPPD